MPVLPIFASCAQTKPVTESLALSVVVPVLDEAATLPALLAHLRPLQAAGVQVIIVDGGSRDGTPDLVRAGGFGLRVAPRGRGRQMNAGAGAATGDVVLFLHADTRLPGDVVRKLAKARTAGAVWGRFDVRIDGNSRWFPVISTLMNLRSRVTGIATGDQAMFVRTDLFRALGGFAGIPLMEDIELCTRLRRHAPPDCLRACVTTSGRRWEQHGVVRTVVRMWSLRLRYFLGADPAQLAVVYGYRPAGDDG